MHHNLIFNNKNLQVSFKSLCLLNFLYFKQANGNALPQLKKTAMADFMGVYRSALSAEIDELSKAKVLESSKVLIDEGKLKKSTIIDASKLTFLPVKHRKLNDLLLERMYTDRTIKGRRKRLNEKNCLLLCLLLSFADESGRITQLSQTNIKSLLNISEAQLKSQLQKLKKLSILEVRLPGGSYHAVAGRVKSKLQLNLTIIESLALTEHASTRDSLYLDRVKTEPKVELIELRSVSRLAELLQSSSEKTKRLASQGLIHPLKRLEGFSEALGGAKATEKARFYSYLGKLCIGYAELLINKLSDQIPSIAYLPFDRLAELAKSDKKLQRAATHIYRQIFKDLSLRGLLEFYCLENNYKADSPGVRELVSEQKQLIFRTTVMATALIVSEVYTQLFKDNDNSALPKNLRLRLCRNDNELLVIH